MVCLAHCSNLARGSLQHCQLLQSVQVAVAATLGLGVSCSCMVSWHPWHRCHGLLRIVCHCGGGGWVEVGEVGVMAPVSCPLASQVSVHIVLVRCQSMLVCSLSLSCLGKLLGAELMLLLGAPAAATSGGLGA